VSELIFKACKELIDDAKLGSPDLVFKEVCLDVLSRARNVLSDEQFKQLVAYAEERMKERIALEVSPLTGQS
jgi:Holliday junction resolvase RusA-like endonuclease